MKCLKNLNCFYDPELERIKMKNNNRIIISPSGFWVENDKSEIFD